MKSLLIAAIVLPIATSAAAQSVVDCDWQASSQALIEPWEDNSATFSDGAVRLAMLDTIEPAAGAMHLLVLSPPYDEVGSRQCMTIGSSDGVGFSGIMWADLTSGYDPDAGLIFEVPVSQYDPDTDGNPTSLLSFTLDQSTGKIDAVILADVK